MSTKTKVTPQSIAEALVHMCKTLPQDQFPAAMEAALDLLVGAGFKHVIPTFEQIVTDALCKASDVRVARVTVGLCDEKEVREQIGTTLRKLHGGEWDIRVTVDPGIIGGAKLRIGDDQYDLTAATALKKLATQFAS